MKLTGRSQMISHYNYSEAIDRLIDFGYDGVEISIFDKQFNLRQEFFQEDTIEAIRSAMKRRSECSYCVSAHQDYIYSDEVYEAILKAVPVVAELGIDILIISGTAKRAETDAAAEEEWQRMIERTKAIVLLAESRGIRVAVEFEPNFIVGSTKDLHRLFGDIESDYLGANLDLGHVFLCDEKPMEAIKSLQGKIFNGHIEDMATDVHDHLVPGEGDMDLGAYVNQLKAIGFDGSLGLDLYKYDYEAVSEQSLEFLRKLI